MAVISTHTLNGTDGTHAGGIGVTLTNRSTGQTLFATATDDGGRLVQQIVPERIDPQAGYELVLATGPYWASRAVSRAGPQIMDEIVLRFALPDPAGAYHLPVILSPYSYSVWWSA